MFLWLRKRQACGKPGIERKSRALRTCRPVGQCQTRSGARSYSYHVVIVTSFHRHADATSRAPSDPFIVRAHDGRSGRCNTPSKASSQGESSFDSLGAQRTPPPKTRSRPRPAAVVARSARRARADPRHAAVPCAPRVVWPTIACVRNRSAQVRHDDAEGIFHVPGSAHKSLAVPRTPPLR